MRLLRACVRLGGLLFALASCQGPTPDAASCEGQPRARCVRSVSVGGRFACAALRDQSVWCWGRNDENQLGYESSDLCPERLANGQTRAVACHSYPLQVVGLPRVVALSAGGAHVCAVLATGELRCWGSNARGQLGNGSTLPSRAPVAVGGFGRVVSVAAGALHTCVAVETGEVFCWGANDRGQLGARGALSACEAGGTSVACARTPVRVADVTDAVEVAAGDAHTCARTRDGRVWCWGTNTDGQLGAGTASESPTPRAQVVLLGASALRQVRSLAAGGDHTCATRDDGAVLCWGRHDRGQVGVAVPESFAPCAHACVRTAVPIAGFEGAPLPEDPDAGFEDFDGALEPADAASEDVAPESAEPPPTARVIAAGGAFSCLTLSDGTVRCWGTNRSYELGNGRMNEGGAALTTVIASPGSAATNSLQGAVHVESGAATSCVVSANRALKCWGSNEFGALGVGNTVEQNGPVPVTW